jgi:signal transduction histidine kinase/CheY-like chemotaxis protein
MMPDGRASPDTTDLDEFNRWLAITRLRASGGVLLLVVALGRLGIGDIHAVRVLAVVALLALTSTVVLGSALRRRAPRLVFHVQTLADLGGITAGIALAVHGRDAVFFHLLYALVIVPSGLVSAVVGTAVAAAASGGHLALLGLERGFDAATFVSVDAIVLPMLFALLAQQCCFYGSHLRRKNVALGDLAERLGESRRHFEEQWETARRLAAERGLLLERQAENEANLMALVDELEQARARAEDSSRVKSEFLANMSHEIRTPMNGVLGMTELALGLELPDEVRECLETIGRSGEALLALLNDILDLSKIEAGRLELEAVPFDLADMLRDVRALFVPRAREKGVALDCRIVEGVPDALLGDPVRTRQVLTNLVGNAIKFTDRGEVEVTVTGEGREEGTIVLHFAVRDTGIGIPADKQARIFEPFAQADGSTTRRYGGTGLGLAISSELAQKQGGRIRVESEPGRGSTFHFTAPFGVASAAVSPTPGESPAVEPAARRDNAAGRRLRVLLAEDNPVNRRIATAMLERRGWAVVVAEDGVEAVAAVERESFDVVLMDVQMPTLDGFEATALIRRREAATGAHVPIVALTAHALREDHDRCLAAGMDAFLSKPLRAADLVATVERLAGAPAAAPAGTGVEATATSGR